MVAHPILPNQIFWRSPPWQDGRAKHSLGLQPILTAEWLTSSPGDERLANKKRQLSARYDEVVGVLPGHNELDDILTQLPWPSTPGQTFKHAIVNKALTVAPDLCVLDVPDDQRLIAGCVCAPSYWRLAEKLGQPLAKVHEPVDGMNKKIGDNIRRFIANAPRGQVFGRCNWFLHGDAQLFHDVSEGALDLPVEQWFVRCERQSLCRISERYLLFTIDVICEPLADIESFVDAQTDLVTALATMDADEINHFGGLEKHRRLADYVARF